MSKPILCESKDEELADYVVTTEGGTVLHLCGVCVIWLRNLGVVGFTIEEIPGRFDDRGIIR